MYNINSMFTYDIIGTDQRCSTYMENNMHIYILYICVCVCLHQFYVANVTHTHTQTPSTYSIQQINYSIFCFK